METVVRDDGSTFQNFYFDPKTGDRLGGGTKQGLSATSCWSRGQAWALYGFAISYIHTGEVRYLDAAKQVANYFIANCCDDWLPRVDFRAPAEPVMYDSTAGACAACGLLELAKIVSEPEAKMYADAAKAYEKDAEGNYYEPMGFEVPNYFK